MVSSAYQLSRLVLILLSSLSIITSLIYMGAVTRHPDMFNTSWSQKDYSQNWHFWVGWVAVSCYLLSFVLTVAGFWFKSWGERGLSNVEVDFGIEESNLGVVGNLERKDSKFNVAKRDEAELPNYTETRIPEDSEAVGTMTSGDRRVLERMMRFDNEQVRSESSFETIIRVSSRKPSALKTTRSGSVGSDNGSGSSTSTSRLPSPPIHL